jgi:NAD(P)H-hydrate epimerase
MPLPVISTAQMREWEAATWAAGRTEAEVIRRVGQRVARRAQLLTREGDLLLLLAGKGHNGDDVRAAQEFLTGRKIKILDLAQPETDLPALENALKEKPALVIDGLFGTGLNRPLADSWQKIIATVNAAGIPVLSVDVPSGLNADTGETFGAAIQAHVTLTVGAPKTGMLAEQAWPFVGRLEVAEDIGLVDCPLPGDWQWTLPGDFKNFPPVRKVWANKSTYGHLSIIAGSFGFHGAAVLSTRGAQRAQPGLVTLFTQENVYHPVASQLQSAMVNLWQADTKKMSSGFDALLVGPGLAARDLPSELRHTVRHWWRDYEHPMILDASALDLVIGEPFLKKLLRVLTPHPGEAARLLNWPIPKVQGNRILALRELSKKFGGAWVVLKGHQTLIGRAEGKIFTNPSGNPHLAQGGSGDVLSGFIAGLLVQPWLRADVETTLRYAVWQHGAAADELQTQRANWLVEDLVAKLGDAAR